MSNYSTYGTSQDHHFNKVFCTLAQVDGREVRPTLSGIRPLSTPRRSGGTARRVPLHHAHEDELKICVCCNYTNDALMVLHSDAGFGVRAKRRL